MLRRANDGATAPSGCRGVGRRQCDRPCRLLWVLGVLEQPARETGGAAEEKKTDSPVGFWLETLRPATKLKTWRDERSWQCARETERQSVSDNNNTNRQTDRQTETEPRAQT